jgi:hypothetical protein
MGDVNRMKRLAQTAKGEKVDEVERVAKRIEKVLQEVRKKFEK